MAMACLGLGGTGAVFGVTGTAVHLGNIALKQRNTTTNNTTPTSTTAPGTTTTSSNAASSGALRPQTVQAPNPQGGISTLPGVDPNAVGRLSDNGKGMIYPIKPGSGTLDPRVTQIRVVDPDSPMAPDLPRYPDGYVVYMNNMGQTVNPYSGQTTKLKTDPMAHFKLPPP
jgi:hypothetical protein